MAAISIVSPERRIELNPFDVDAWNLLVRESHARPIDQVRPFYERLVAQFPNAGRYWKAFIEHELRAKNFENVEALFSRCLTQVLNIDLWKCYVHYVRETKGHLSTFREKMAKTYDFALDKVGLDMHAYSIYADYISFLKTVPAVGQYAENQRITAVRRVYHRGVSTPMVNVEQLWSEYCSYEKSVNATLAEKLISERNKEYQVAKKVTRTLEQMTRGINRQAVSVPPRGTAAEMKQVEMWKKYIAWEKSNPMATEDYGQFAKRVVYAYEQALLCLGYYPDIWYEGALFQQTAAQQLEDKGDVNLAKAMTSDVIKLFERAVNGLQKDSQLIYFAYADFEEERMKFADVEAIYNKIIKIETIDPTLAYIQLMKFKRRTEGIKAARTVFKRAREDERTRYHIFIANALMEYYCSKETGVAMRVFDLGLKKYPDEPEYALAYVEFLSHLNEDNNTRVVFERILTSGQMPPEKSAEIWDRYLEFESQVGDLTSTLKVDARRREALSEEYGDLHTLLLIDRYKFLSLVPCTQDQLKLMGYNKYHRGALSTIGGTSGTVPRVDNSAPNRNQPQAASVVMGGGTSLDISGYPRPDTDQMIPFKPKREGRFIGIAGGVFPPPPAAAQLMQMLPPPHTFHGPFVAVDHLIASILRFDMPVPTVDMSKKPEPNSVFGTYKMEDVKRDTYQLIATTTDPNAVVISSGDGGRKRRTGGDSDDESGDAKGNIYKKRMNKTGVISGK